MSTQHLPVRLGPAGAARLTLMAGVLSLALSGCVQTDSPAGSAPTLVDESSSGAPEPSSEEETSVDLAPEFGSLGTLPGGDGSAPPYVLQEVDLPEGWRPSNPSGPYPSPLSVCDVVAPTPTDAATRRWARETLGPFLESHAMTSEPGSAEAFVQGVRTALEDCTSMDTESGKVTIEQLELGSEQGATWVGWRVTHTGEESMVSDFAARSMDDALIVMISNSLGDKEPEPAVLDAAIVAADRSLPHTQ